MSVTDPNGNEIDYIYDAFGLLTQVSLATNNQKSANYVYTNDRLTGISNNGTTYLISYNLWGELQSVSVGSQPIITYSYGEGASRSRITQVDYANGTTVCYSYDLAGNVIFVEVQSDDYYKSFNYEYDAQNNLCEISATDVRIVRYTDGRTDILDCDGEYIYSSYTDNNDFIEVINGVTYTTKDYDSQYDYTTGETVSKSDVTSSVGKTVGTISKTDWFGRTTESVVQTKSANNTDSTVPFAKITTQYGYPNYADNKTSNRLEYVMSFVDSDYSSNFYGTKYTYDSNGNIIEEYECDVDGTCSESDIKYSYVYDELNQLVRVNDNIKRITYVFDYDNSGNITTKREYSYTLNTPRTLKKTTEYTYDSVWGDKLISYQETNNQTGRISPAVAFTYDAIGNPTSIGADTLTWSGRELTSYTKGNQSIAYTYDENGLRSTKTVTSGNTTEIYDYVWVDGKLVSQSYTVNSENPKSAKFIYGSSGDVQGFIYNDVTYLYVKNLQGDIIAIVNENGDEVVRISYDAWGKPAYSIGSLGNNQLLGLFEKLSPFSYRGYCYDTDIELYYLQSRYYNPELCRFINTDDTNIAIQTQGDILGVNLFAYCENNPIINVDYSGYFSKSDIGDIFKKIFNAVKDRIKNYVKKNIGYIENGYIYIANSFMSKTIDTLIYASHNAIVSSVKSATFKSLCSAAKSYAKNNISAVATFFREKLFGKILNKIIPDVYELTIKTIAKIWAKKVALFYAKTTIIDRLTKNFTVYQFISSITSIGGIVAIVFDIIDGKDGYVKIKI